MSRGRILIAALVLLFGAAFAYTLVKLGDAGETAENLKNEVRRLRSRVDALGEKPNAAAAPADLRSIERRLERLELAQQTGAPWKVAAPTGAPGTAPRAGASREGGTWADLLSADGGAQVGALLESAPFRRALGDFLKSSVKQLREDRRAERFQRWDKRLQQEMSAFGKQQGLNQPQIEQLTSILQESRDRRQEIRRQMMSAEIDTGAARKQIEDLKTGTQDRIKELLGEKGYEGYQEWRKQNRQTWRSLWRF